MSEEIWKDIKGYEGKYKISNFGKVKSLYFINRQAKIPREKILSYGYNLQGYPFVHLCKNNITSKVIYIHRLVATHFINNPQNLKCVNHINGIKTDNRVENLEWCTQKYNIQQSFKNGQQKPTWINKTGKLNPLSKKVNQYDLNNKFIRTWDCMRDVERELNIYAINVSKCCRNVIKSAGGYKWRFTND